MLEERGTDGSEKFFGVTVGAEKEMIFIVADGNDKEQIMSNIMQEAGSNSPAQSVVFSMPATELGNMN